MELSQINSMNHISQLSDTQKSFQVNDLQNTKEVIEKYPSDKIEIQEQNSSSSFLSNISTNINKIVDLQKKQSLISNQLEITSQLVTTTNSALNSNKIQLDDKEPEIKNLLDSFNKIAESFERPEISDEVGIYFDGQLGSKPLSSNEILDAVSQQRERLSQFNQQIASEVKSLVSNTKETIATEKTTVETKVEFKNIDYAKESAQFDSSTLNSVKGGILPSQANAFPLHSEKLLA